MNFVISFGIWVVAGVTAGWLAGRAEGYPAAARQYVLTGLTGAILGGFLWQPFFFAAQPVASFAFLFDFLSFHLFAALFGATAGFWAIHIASLARNRGSNSSIPN